MKEIQNIKTKIRIFIKQRVPYFNPLVNLFFGKEKANEEDTFRGKNYIDPTKTVAEKIQLERRRRNYFYKVLEYCLNSYTYYDYLTVDAVKVIRHASYYSNLLNKEIIDTDLLFLAFCQVKGCVSIVLEKHGLHKKDVEEFFSAIIAENPEQVEIFEKRKRETLIRLWVRRISFFIPAAKKLVKWDKQTLRTSEGLDDLLEKAAENALKKYKTPVITTEILFLTLMEEQQLKGGKIIKFLLESDHDTIWHLVRYDLLRSLYYDESGIRSQLPGNQHYYAYLLKTQISEFKFKKIIQNQRLISIITIFRSQLIKSVLDINLAKLIRKDVRRTIKINTTNTKRIYYDLEDQENMEKNNGV